MKSLFLVLYTENGFSPRDIFCAVCESDTDVRNFILENDDISVVRVMKERMMIELQD